MWFLVGLMVWCASVTLALFLLWLVIRKLIKALEGFLTEIKKHEKD